MNAVGVALVGCGAMGEIVAREVYPSVTADGSAELVAVVDPDEARAAAAAEASGARAYRTLGDASAAERIDAVDVRVPHHLHAAVALEAIGHGLHVLVEKPLATTFADGRRIVDAAAAAGVVLAVAENYPQLGAVHRARQVLADGRIGEPLAIQCTRAFRVDGVWVRDGWRESGGPSGGVLLDQGTHQVSLLRQLGGPVTSVAATRSASTGESLDTLLLTFRLESGVVAQSVLTWHSPGPWDQPEATVFGSAGRLDVVVDYEQDKGGCVTWTPDGVAREGAENYYGSHVSIVTDWISAIRAGRQPLVTGQDGLADLAVVVAAAESLATGGSFVMVNRG
ncbi:Gfo/Idh/MocA family protein [Flindersiella endophytica]